MRILRSALSGLLAAVALLGVVGAASARSHEVAKGETLTHIARQYGVTVTALRAKNSIERGKPLQIGQRLEIPGKGEEPKPKDLPQEVGGAWVTAKPASATQTQKSPDARGGVNPCLTKDPGYGVYSRWDRSPSMGQMIAPERGGVLKDGRFDVVFHFHGHEPVRKEWVQVMRGPVLVGVDLGIGSGPYAQAFASPDAFKKLVESVEDAMAKRSGKKNARVRHVGLSAWSAGYGAVEMILRSAYGRRVVDSVILLDGLHSGYSGDTLNEKQLEPFVEFARRARSKETFMFVSHSSIIPPGYASTTETANFLIWKLGGRPAKVAARGSDPMGLDLISRYSRGNFHVRGYAGNDKMDHCAHIGLLRDVLKVHVAPRWRSPRGWAARATPRG